MRTLYPCRRKQNRLTRVVHLLEQSVPGHCTGIFGSRALPTTAPDQSHANASWDFVFKCVCGRGQHNILVGGKPSQDSPRNTPEKWVTLSGTHFSSGPRPTIASSDRPALVSMCSVETQWRVALPGSRYE